MTMNIFEFAARNKLRFPSVRGGLSVEQLWDVPLRSKDDFNLNAVARVANDAVKNINEEGFVETTTRTDAHSSAETILKIVKHVIASKLADEASLKKRAETKVRMEKLLTALAEKQDGRLSAMSEKELKRQIDELQDES